MLREKYRTLGRARDVWNLLKRDNHAQDIHTTVQNDMGELTGAPGSAYIGLSNPPDNSLIVTVSVKPTDGLASKRCICSEFIDNRLKFLKDDFKEFTGGL